MGWGVHCVQLPQEQAHAFFKEMVANIYCAHFKEQKDPIVFTFPVLQAEAW